jgi:hypothetical protein
MRYDLDLVNRLCREIGLIVVRQDADRRLEIDLGRNALLCFQNAEREEDCLTGFVGVPWHVHDNLMFVDARGNYIELDYLNLLTGLKEGRVLICERELNGQTVDRWLVHSEYNDEFKYLNEDERINVRRAPSNRHNGTEPRAP